MCMKKLLLLSISLLLLAGTAQAQLENEEELTEKKIKISGEVFRFNSEIRAAFRRTGDTIAMEVGDRFDLVWSGPDYSNEQKQRIVNQAKRLRDTLTWAWTPDMVHYIATMAYAAEFTDLARADMDSLITVNDKVISHYSKSEAKRYFQRMRYFFYTHALYYSRFHRTYFSEGTYHFTWVQPLAAPTVPDYYEEEVSEEPTDDEFSDDYEADDGWDDDSWDTAGDDGWGDDDDSWGSDDGWGSGDDSGWGDDTATEETLDEPEDGDHEIWHGEAEDPNAMPAYLVGQEETLPQEGPVIVFDDIEIVFATHFDSTYLSGSSGSYAVMNETFIGKGGRIDFWPAGYDPDSVYAELEDYSFRTSRTSLTAENATLHFDRLINEPVKGRYVYNSSKPGPDGLSSYPRFYSYGNQVIYKLKDKKLSLKGGITLLGPKINTSSLNAGTSYFKAQEAATNYFNSNSKQYDLEGDTLITSQRAYMALYQKRDSIVHEGVRVRYAPQTEVLKLLEHDGIFRNSPYEASLYKIEFEADEIRWDLKTDSLDIFILNASNEVPALFESRDYYDAQRFNRLSGIYDFHPLLVAVGYGRRNNTLEFSTDDLAESIKQNRNTVHNAMVQLWQEGYIYYEPNARYVTLKRKAVQFVLADRGRIDYDNLLIESISPEAPNATINLESQEMKVRGIEKFYVSRALDVYMFPEKEEITLLPNRDFEFDGQLFAGNYEFIGKEFRFQYDSFLVDLAYIDSIRFYVTDDQNRKEQLDNKLVSESDTLGSDTGPVKGNLRGATGTLYINKPNNKSARANNPQYPIFSAERGAYVYFDDPKVLAGAYDKSVYFQIPAFEIDSVSSSDPSSIAFEGVFSSGGIFPDFEEKLVVQPDNSLGFQHPMPQEGFQIYEGDGNVQGTLKLNARGLQVDGKIDYLTTTIHAADFTFYLDSVTSDHAHTEIKAGQLGIASFPDLNVSNAHLDWVTRKDSMYIRNKEGDQMDMYGGTASLDGVAVVTSKGLYGAGDFLTRGSEAKSNQFKFAESRITGRHAEFEIKSDDETKPALAGTDVKLNFDLDAGLADIRPEISGVAAIDFPYAQVKTSISKAIWDLDNDKVTMTKPENININDSYFYTTKAELDSVAFNATAAEYDINLQILRIHGVPSIKVADAFVMPDEGEVAIMANADIQPLTNARLQIDTINGYHNLIDGNIKILSRKLFEGDATYRYVNAVKDTFLIKLEEFRFVEEPGDRRNEILRHTVSSGEILDVDNVIISPGMIFKGTMTMFATKPALELDGYIKLDLKNIPYYDTWIAYQSSGEAQEVIIDFDNSFTEEGEPLTAGLHLEAGTNRLYATFIFDKYSPEDDDLFIPSGQLRHDVARNQYIIGNPTKEAGERYQGRMFYYNENTSDIRLEGPINFVSSATQGVKVQASGTGTGNLDNSEFDFNTLMTFEFGQLPGPALDAMGLDLLEVVTNLGASEAEPDISALMYKMAELVGEKTTLAYEEASKADYVPLNSISTELAKDLVISNVDLKWNDEQKAFYNVSKIGLAAVRRADINAAVDGFLEIRKLPEGGESINIFLQVTPDTWYYFSLEDNRLLTFSSNAVFNDQIAKRSNIDKAKIGEMIFVNGDLQTALDFINRFRLIYFNIDTPYDLQMSESMDDFDTIVEEEEDFDIFGDPAEEEDDDDDDGF